MVEKGQPWERPASGPAEWHVAGDDATLAAAVRDRPGARVEFRPDGSSDLARALGLDRIGRASLELPVDALRIVADGRELFAVNMVVVGVAPDRARWSTRTPAVHVRSTSASSTTATSPGSWSPTGSTCGGVTSCRAAIRVTVGPRSRCTRSRAGSVPACGRGSPRGSICPTRHHPDHRSPRRDPGRHGPARARDRRRPRPAGAPASPSTSSRRHSSS